MLFEVVKAVAYGGTQLEANENEERIWQLSAGSEWDVTSDNVIKFVRKVNKKIEVSAKEYTTFKSTPSQRDFPSLLRTYLGDESSFDNFHRTYTEHKLAPSLSSSRLEEGAVIVFIHYRIRQEPRVIVGEEAEEYDISELEIIKDHFQVLMVRNTGALKFTEDYQISETSVIDLKQFVQGCQIDLARFSADEGTPENPDNFLTFVKGSSDVRDYFKDSIFAEKGITNKASSQNVERAINDFWHQHKASLNRTVRDEINSNVYTFSEENKKQVVTLEQISAIVDRCIPDESAALRGQFVDFANEGPYEINDEFELSSNIIKELVYVNLDVGFAKLVLDKSEIGELSDSNRHVKFDQDTGQVTFTTTLNEDQIKVINSILGINQSEDNE
ncbi:nucleoid-associated protein [Vibrio vulnificus]|uniref:nucleoid-associated protein n=1 Tax=Vibrio vulnificus TaxID=672 RepID=UPI003ED9D423|nr:nucleoid-associated protein [Vibrio parahaemolyticus]